MNRQLIEELLHEDESASLDFKRDQYLISGATDEQKSELIKDILAFANSWRRSEAYILIGIDSTKGSNPNVVGIKDDLDDAAIQQLVNGKTNRPINFSYYTYLHEEKRIGIIEIPVQERPIFLRKGFGKLKAATVYLRRGSSTAIADPDEIAQMGKSQTTTSIVPTIELQFYHLENNAALSTHIELTSTLVIAPPRNEIPQIPSSSQNLIQLININTEFYREFADYLIQRSILHPLQFCIKNTGPIIIQNARMEARIAKDTNIELINSSDFPYPPSSHGSVFDVATLPNLGPEPNISVKEFDSEWVIYADFRSVQPKALQHSAKIYIGATSSRLLHISAVIYADNLSDPVEIEMEIDFTVTSKNITVEQLREIADQYSSTTN